MRAMFDLLWLFIFPASGSNPSRRMGNELPAVFQPVGALSLPFQRRENRCLKFGIRLQYIPGFQCVVLALLLGIG